MFARLLTPRWLGLLLAAIAFAGLCVFLGNWQLGRHQARVERNDTLDRNYSAPARPLSELLNGSVTSAQEWSVVTAEGTWRPSPFGVRNRTNNGDVGADVVGVVDLSGGGTLLVEAGFAPNQEGGTVPPVLLPSGPTEVTGWIRLSEQSRNLDMPAGVLSAIDPAEASRALGGQPVLPVYVRLQSPLPGLQALEEPSRSIGPHLAYAIQWWITTVAGFAFVYVGIRRELRDEEAAADAAVESGAPGAPSAPVPRSRRRPSLAEEEDLEVEQRR